MIYCPRQQLPHEQERHLKVNLTTMDPSISFDKVKFVLVLSKNPNINQLSPHIAKEIIHGDFYEKVERRFYLFLKHNKRTKGVKANDSDVQIWHSFVDSWSTDLLEILKWEEEDSCDDDEYIETVAKVDENDNYIDAYGRQESSGTGSYLGELQINDFSGTASLESDTNAPDKNIELDNYEAAVEMRNDVKKKTLYDWGGKIEDQRHTRQETTTTKDHLGELLTIDSVVSAGFETDINATDVVREKLGNLDSEADENQMGATRFKTSIMIEHLVAIRGDAMVTARDGLPWYIRRKRVRFRA